MSIKYSYEEIVNNLREHGYNLDIPKEDFTGVTTTKLYAHDDIGYKYVLVYDRIMNNCGSHIAHKTNPFSIDNINLYLKNNNVHFICISNCDDYKNKNSELKFKCLYCGNIVTSTWSNINRNDNPARKHIICSNCDNYSESLHASVLKQMFLHEYPDTIVEEKSFVNPLSKRICPTDIVNHRLKIAIEIQSQWHDYEDIKIKDKMKKDYWINKGYKFYDPDIRHYSILEMCRLFFDIDKLPSYINYNYSKRVNAYEIQNMLDEGFSISEIANILGVKTYVIYDAALTGKIKYPSNYIRADYAPVVKFDINWNYIEEYKTIKEAADCNNLKAGSLSSALNHGRNFFGGYNWMRKKNKIKKYRNY